MPSHEQPTEEIVVSEAGTETKISVEQAESMIRRVARGDLVGLCDAIRQIGDITNEKGLVFTSDDQVARITMVSKGEGDRLNLLSITKSLGIRGKVLDFLEDTPGAIDKIMAARPERK